VLRPKGRKRFLWNNYFENIVGYLPNELVDTLQIERAIPTVALLQYLL
jgi:hypothetical protein